MINLNDAEASHRFVVRALDPDMRPRSVIGWRASEVRRGRVVRAVVLTLDDAWVVLSPEQADQLAAALADAAHTRASGLQ